MPVSVAVADARKRAKRNKPESRRLAEYKATAALIEDGFGGATAGTIARLREAPLARLMRKGKLDTWTESAANSIQFAFNSSAGSSALHHPDLGIRQSARPGAADTAAAKRADSVVAYVQWRKDLAGTTPLAMAMAVLIDEVQLSVLDEQHRQRKGTAFDHLVVALRHYAALLGNTPRGARGWRYERQKLRPANK